MSGACAGRSVAESHGGSQWHRQLSMMGKAVESGARGATIGRNIWGTSDPTGELVAFRGVIHDGLEPEAALKRAGLG